MNVRDKSYGGRLSDVDIFFFKQKTAYEMRISDWSSDVCSSDLENDATTTRRGAFAMTASMTGPMSRSGAVKPATSAFVESTIARSTPSSPNRADRKRVV